MENSLDLIENGMKEIVEAAENDNHLIHCDKEILVESSDNKVTLANSSSHEATENNKDIENNAKGDEGLGGGGEDTGDKYVKNETSENTQEITSATNGTNKETDKTDLASDDGEVFPSMVVHQIVSRETSVEPEPGEFATSMASHHVSQSADLQENQDLHQEEEIATMASNISKEINDLVEKDVEISRARSRIIIVEQEVESVVNGESGGKIEDVVIQQDDTQENEEKDCEIPQQELLNSNEEVSEFPDKTEPEAIIQIESNDKVEINVTTSEEVVGDESDSNNSESFPSMLSHQIALEPKSVDYIITMTTHQIASREASMEPKFLDSGTSMATHRISTCYDEDFSVPGETVIEDNSDLAKETAIDPDMPHLESFSSMVVHQIASREASMEPKVIDSTTSMSAHQVGSRETSTERKLMDSGTSMASHRISAAFDDNTKLIEDKAENVESLEPDVAEEIINATECKEESGNECQNKPSEEDNETNEITKKTLQKQESDEDTISGEEIPIIASFTFGNNSAIVQDIKMENQAADNIKEVKHHINDEPSIIIDDLDEECIEEGEAITASCTFGNNKPIVIETKIPDVNTNGAEEDKESRDNYDKVSSEIITEIVNQRFSRNISNGDAVKEPEKIDKIEPSPKVEKEMEIDLPKVEVIAKEPTPLPESKPPKKSILETLFGCFGCFKGQQS